MKGLKGIRQCSNCNKNIEIYHKKRMESKNVFCSLECKNEFAKSKDLNTVCMFCGKKYHLKPYQKNRTETHCCSKECLREYKKIIMKGENNHQYGLKGNLNSSWKSDEQISNYGYRLIRKPNHPFRNSKDMVFEHRLIAEKYLLTEENSVIIDGEKYLSPDFHVHHKDFNKLNNNVENLEVLLKGDHMALHNKLRDTPRDAGTGRFVSL